MKTNVICNSCHGKGGFKINKDKWYDQDWSDCPMCDGYGFLEEASDSQIKDALDFDFFRKKITEAFEPYADINMMTYDEFGKDICIHLTSTNGTRVDQILRNIITIGNDNPNVKCTINRVYFQEDGRTYDYWKLMLNINQINDLESLLENIRDYRKSGGGGLSIGYNSIPYKGVRETT